MEAVKAATGTVRAEEVARMEAVQAASEVVRAAGENSSPPWPFQRKQRSDILGKGFWNIWMNPGL